MPEVKQTLVIERERWLRGELGNESQLLRLRDGKQCCLGFYGLECGYTEDEISGQSEPAEMCLYLDEKRPRWPTWLVAPDDERGRLFDTDDCIKLIETNDNAFMGESEREERIRGIFAGHGVEVIFR